MRHNFVIPRRLISNQETDNPPLTAAGARLPWAALPVDLRARIEMRLGARVLSATDQPGGFSPGAAALLRLDDGTDVFVKAVHPSGHVDAPRLHRREARIASQLPAYVPTPRLLWSIDDGEESWIVLAFEAVTGRNPHIPWSADELARVVHALARLADTLTPSPVDDDETVGEHFRQSFNGWRSLAEGGERRLDDWSNRNLTGLVEVEAAAPAAAAGDSLVHLDVRGDNILVTEDRVLFVDWPHARVGAAWVDMIGFAPSVAMQGGPEPAELLDMFPARLRGSPDDEVAVIAALAGFFTERSLLPEPTNLPGLRAFQAAQGVVARRWLANGTGWR